MKERSKVRKPQGERKSFQLTKRLFNSDDADMGGGENKVQALKQKKGEDGRPIPVLQGAG